jgi:hypothetical protein
VRRGAPRSSGTGVVGVERKTLERLASTPFVGREALLAHLEGGLARGMDGRATWVLLAGEPGLGYNVS